MKILLDSKLSMELLIFFSMLFYILNCSVGQYALRSYKIKARINTFFATSHLRSYQNPHIKPTWCASQCIDLGGSCKAFTFSITSDTRRCILHSRKAKIDGSDLMEMTGSFYYDMESCSQGISQGGENCQVSSTAGVFATSSTVPTISDVTLPTTVPSTEQTTRPTTLSTKVLSTTTMPTIILTTVETTIQTTKQSTMQISELTTKSVTTLPTSMPTTTLPTSIPTTTLPTSVATTTLPTSVATTTLPTSVATTTLPTSVATTTLPTSIPTTLQTTIEPSTGLTTLKTTEGTTTKSDSTVPAVLYGDCYDILHTGGSTKSGVYKILLNNGSIIDVYCDMDTDGGGWTVIQRRQDGTVDFYRYWNEYIQGFGNLDGEFWLGNNAIYMLTFQDNVQLRFDLIDFDDAHNVAVYQNFRIGDETGLFQLSLGTRIQGLAAGDSMQHHNGRQFSTRDRDNDNQNQADTCAEKYRGGWWYGSCMRANLNGIYLHAPDGPYPTGYEYGLAWYYWHGTHAYSLKRTEMKIRKESSSPAVPVPF